jgi:uncharacterized membrane protein
VAELTFGAIACLGFSFLIFGWGMFQQNKNEKKQARSYFWWCFTLTFLIYIYNSDFWKSPLWQ